MAEWRRGEERTATACARWRIAVSRIGETVEAMDALKPVPDLSLSMLEAPGAGSAPRAIHCRMSMPTARVHWRRNTHRFALDAADYAPGRPPSAGNASSEPTPRKISCSRWASPACPAPPDLRDVEPIRPPLLVETAHAPAHEEPMAPPVAPNPAPESSDSSRRRFAPPPFAPGCGRCSWPSRSRQRHEAGGPARPPRPHGRLPVTGRGASPRASCSQRASPCLPPAAICWSTSSGSPTLPGGPAGIEQGAGLPTSRRRALPRMTQPRRTGAPEMRASENDATPPQQEAPHKAPAAEDQTGSRTGSRVEIRARQCHRQRHRGGVPRQGAASPSPVETTASIPTASRPRRRKARPWACCP